MKKTGVLISNLGTPSAPTPSAIRKFLAEFLWDPRVIEVPRPLWWLILNGVILRIRPKKVAKIYQAVWTEKGSPLMAISLAQKEKLQQALGDDYVVALGMRYGTPSIRDALLELRKAGVEELIVLPLYPQFSATTSGSTFDETMRLFKKCRGIPNIRFIRDYHDHPLYIKALAESVKTHWEKHGRADRLIMSFHGLPQSYVDKGDPYYDQSLKTAELLASELGLSNNDWEVSFQSRVGNKPWLQPYTDVRMQALPKEGVKSIQVICPGFSADCIETLEEIDMENRQFFIEAGGEQFEYIEALNDSSAHITLMESTLKF